MNAFSKTTIGSARGSRFAVSAKIDRTLDGIVFDSKKEASRYAELKLLERAGEILGLVMQPAFEVEINGSHFCTFTADFAYYERARLGRIIEDVKSTGTAKDSAYRLRKKAAELAHGIKVIEVIR